MSERVGLIERVRRFSERQVREYGAQYNAFCLFIGLFFVAAPYRWVNPGHYPEYVLLSLRVIPYIFCGIILVRKFWPLKLQPYLPLFWHFTLFYCFPFRTTFNVLYSQHSSSFNKFGVLGIVALAVLVDRTSFVILLALGIIGGTVFFVVTGAASAMMPDRDTIFLAILMYSCVTFTKLVFFRNNEIAHEKKIADFRLLAGSIAHEMRNPLVSLATIGSTLTNMICALVDGYRQAQKAGLPVQPISPTQLDKAEFLCGQFKVVIEKALSTIDQLLGQISVSASPRKSERFALSEAINNAINEYPFKPGERELVLWRSSNDFMLRGSHKLFAPVISNLLNNSMSAITSAGKGTIEIWVESEKKNRVVRFRDSALGISPMNLPHIFEHFYSNKEHGTGIGLALSKLIVEDHGGTISCNSVEGEYAEFVLSFPQNGGNKWL